MLLEKGSSFLEVFLYWHLNYITLRLNVFGLALLMQWVRRYCPRLQFLGGLCFLETFKQCVGSLLGG